MLKHKQLADWLSNVRLDNKQLPNSFKTDLLSFASVGVLPEACDRDSSTSSQTLVGGESINTASVIGQPTKNPYRKPTGFRWGIKSKNELNGVRKELIQCATLALEYYTRIDFTCFDGLRTPAEQAQYVKNGTSRTMNSKHLTGDAVDLVPIIGGVPKWDWDGCFMIAFAMDNAANELGIANKIRWGGAWDRTLADFGGDANAYRAEVEAYKKRHAGDDFIDGPHFEWVN